MSGITVYELIKFLELERKTDYVGIDYILAIMEDESIPNILKVTLIMQCIAEAVDVFNDEYEPKELGELTEYSDTPVEIYIIDMMETEHKFTIVLN